MISLGWVFIGIGIMSYFILKGIETSPFSDSKKEEFK